ncbi:homeobox domain protein [Ancylostoma duodenale]|uniref:Homeobox domain protein n=1 Tax=Ancylostoma duodenale TaxID=51022 RepID=A0A0C2HB69_9BILA|nr:homeobox domain protein [Ancylostoma duodenale]
MQKTQQKRKGGQIRFTNEQTDALEHKFDSHKYLSPQERKKLAKSLSLSERQGSCGQSIESTEFEGERSAFNADLLLILAILSILPYAYEDP